MKRKYSISNIKFINPQDIKNQAILIRVDFNVPIENNIIKDDLRIKRSIKTIQKLKTHNKIIIISHLGRPKGIDTKYSLKPISEYLKNLDIKNIFLNQFDKGFKYIKQFIQKSDEHVFLLENLRFSPLEKENNLGYAKEYASLANIYINDAFSVSHRHHASVSAITKLLPSYAGLCVYEEIKNLERLFQAKRPFVSIIGGAKISDKISAIKNLATMSDVVLTGGGVSNNFLKALGIEIHKSYLEEKSKQNNLKTNFVNFAKRLISKFKNEKMLKDGYIPIDKIVYPIDVLAGENLESKNYTTIQLTKNYKDTPNDLDLMYLDIGPKTQKLYTDIIKDAKTIFWNGPLGVFENKTFSKGTKAIIEAIISNKKAFSVIGGGDTLNACKQLVPHSLDNFSYISTGGGAALYFIGNMHMYGLDGLLKQ